MMMIGSMRLGSISLDQLEERIKIKAESLKTQLSSKAIIDCSLNTRQNVTVHINEALTMKQMLEFRRFLLFYSLFLFNINIVLELPEIDTDIAHIVETFDVPDQLDALRLLVAEEIRKQPPRPYTKEAFVDFHEFLLGKKWFEENGGEEKADIIDEEENINDEFFAWEETSSVTKFDDIKEF